MNPTAWSCRNHWAHAHIGNTIFNVKNTGYSQAMVTSSSYCRHILLDEHHNSQMQPKSETWAACIQLTEPKRAIREARNVTDGTQENLNQNTPPEGSISHQRSAIGGINCINNWNMFQLPLIDHISLISILSSYNSWSTLYDWSLII